VLIINQSLMASSGGIAGKFAARRAALSAARKDLKKKVKEGTKQAGKSIVADAERVSWLEVIFIPLPLAVLNDAIDIFNITIIIDFVTVFLIYAWFYIRVRQGPGKKIFRNLLVFIAEVIPIVGMFPFWIMLVLSVKIGALRAIITLPEKFLGFFKL